MYKIIIINSENPQLYYDCEGAEGIVLNNINKKELDILSNIVFKNNYSIIINKEEKNNGRK